MGRSWFGPALVPAAWKPNPPAIRKLPNQTPSLSIATFKPFVLCHSMVIPTWFNICWHGNAENFSPALTAPINWNTNTSAPPARTAARSPQKIPKTWRDADKETFHKSGLSRIWVDSRVLKNRISSDQMTLRTSEKDEVSILPSCESCPSVMALFI